MTISYNWLSEYLPVKVDPQRLSKILTSIGLEVESLHEYQTIKGGLKGLITAEVISCEKHPDADKLKITRVNTGTETLQVVCGAPNVATGQKVILAPVGTTIFPLDGEPITLRKAKIRGAESQGMICAEDEIGIGQSHEGIFVLPAETPVGKPVAGMFDNYEDFIYEIGLTPNRIDAMSHLGTARDVCAYLMHHDKIEAGIKSPFKGDLKPTGGENPVKVVIENKVACRRYSGITITGISIAESPKWLQQKLSAIGVKSINNIVDITNFILHETGQPLHAFDADKITGNKVVVKNYAEGTSFTTLDTKARKLHADDLMICNAEEGMCIAGVYGGLKSGVTNDTKNIFLESAWFDPIAIRKTSVSHGLRTDAAARFEKGVDISNTVAVLKRATSLILEICGGEASEIVDVYPSPAPQTSIGLKYHYLKKLSGKNYHGDTIKNILKALGFEIAREGQDDIWVNVPYSKPDITIPADLVEEIMRIDGLDNVDIPATISISPSQGADTYDKDLKEKIAGILTGLGYYEIFTNSITNSAYFDEHTLAHTVKLMNNLSTELDVMRPSMIPTGMEVIAHNINRKNANLTLFEFGKTYGLANNGEYNENVHLVLYATGEVEAASWNNKAAMADFYFIKGTCEKVLATCGITKAVFIPESETGFDIVASIQVKNKVIGKIKGTADATGRQFGIKQPVFFADIYWDEMLKETAKKQMAYREISKFPAVQRDLALVLNKNVPFLQIEQSARNLNLAPLQSVKLFDVYESEKLGAGKKSVAVNFTFADNQKTLTDKEIDELMNKLIQAFEKNLDADIRK